MRKNRGKKKKGKEIKENRKKKKPRLYNNKVKSQEGCAVVSSGVISHIRIKMIFFANYV